MRYLSLSHIVNILQRNVYWTIKIYDAVRYIKAIAYEKIVAQYMEESYRNTGYIERGKLFFIISRRISRSMVGAFAKEMYPASSLPRKM